MAYIIELNLMIISQVILKDKSNKDSREKEFFNLCDFIIKLLYKNVAAQTFDVLMGKIYNNVALSELFSNSQYVV